MRTARIKYSLYEIALNFEENSDVVGLLSAYLRFVIEKALGSKLAERAEVIEVGA